MKLRSSRLAILLLSLLLAICICFGGCDLSGTEGGDTTEPSIEQPSAAQGSTVPAGAPQAITLPTYTNKAYVALNDNQPTFKDDEIVAESYEFYSELDSLGRCGYAVACVGKDIMPTEDRESISSVTPSGWINKKYDTSLVDGGYIYNRCHIIGFQLTGENANKKNLITGTRYMNVDGMLPFENMIADYVKESGNHVMYRVTPIYSENELVARGAQLEAYSVEDKGEGICFNVYVFNVQPGISIDYATGNSWLASEQPPANENSGGTGNESEKSGSYVLNTSSKKIHLPTCRYADQISSSNRRDYEGSYADLIAEGYEACGTCKP